VCANLLLHRDQLEQRCENTTPSPARRGASTLASVRLPRSMLSLCRRLARPETLVVAVLVLLPLLVFTYRLQNNPPGFFVDESVYGYEASALVKNGGFSSSGEFLPRLFRNPGETVRNHGVYVYMVMPFVLLFGLNEVAVRLTTVVCSIALLCVIYALLQARVSKWAVFLAALWWPLTGWVFLLSRYGDALIASALASTCAMWMLIRIYGSQKVRNRDILVLDISLIMLFFLYPAGPVLAVGYLLFGLGIYLRKGWPARAIWKPLLSLPAILLLSLGYMLDGTMFFHTAEAHACIFNVGCVARSFASHFRYSSYFADSYIPADFDVLTHSVIGTSLIPRALLLPLGAGLAAACYLIYKRDILPVALLCSFLLGTIPASVLKRGFDSYRSVSLLPIIFVLIILGLNLCVTAISRLPRSWRVLPVLLATVGTLFFGYQEAQKLSAYERNAHAAIDWQYGYPQILDYFARHADEYDLLVVTDTIAYTPELYIRFFDPEGHYTDKIRIARFAGRSLPITKDRTRPLYAARPWEIPPDVLTIRLTVCALNGREVMFYVGDSKRISHRMSGTNMPE
jgi:hypothetical protein